MPGYYFNAGRAVLVSELPTGLVTFLFTDIEGSTRLLQQLGPRYGEALAQQRSLLRAAFAHCHGYEVDTQGDAFFVAFISAPDALSCATDIQRALDSLAPEYRAAVVLCDIEGLSYEEIAATLNVKLGTVRSRIHRGRGQLREALEHRRPAECAQ